MAKKLRLHIRIDDSDNTINRFMNEDYPVVADTGTGKLYRLKIVSGILTQQEIVITDGAIVETGDPITYVKA